MVKINYYLAEITDIRSDDDGEFATVRMLGTQDPLGDSVDTRKIYCKGFAEDDYVVVTVDVDEDGDAFVATINDPATAEGTVTRVKKDADPEEDQGNYVKLDDGNQYNYSKWTEGDVDGINEKHPTLDIATACSWTPTAMSSASSPWMTTMPTTCMWTPLTCP